MKQLAEFLGRTWCKVAHAEPMWPVNGYYRCRVCLRTHPVRWEGAQRSPQPVARGVVASPALAVPPR